MDLFGYIVTWKDNKVIRLYKDGTIENVFEESSFINKELLSGTAEDLIKRFSSNQPKTPERIESENFAKAYRSKK